MSIQLRKWHAQQTQQHAHSFFNKPKERNYGQINYRRNYDNETINFQSNNYIHQSNFAYQANQASALVQLIAQCIAIAKLQKPFEKNKNMYIRF